MRHDGSLPSYGELFDALATPQDDQSRSVYSPAAYLADLLQLLGDDQGGAPPAIAERRPDILRVPLDAEHTQAEVPYLDIVNEVLERAVRQAGDGVDAYQVLGVLRHPFAMPFSLAHVRVRQYLQRLGVDAADFYRLFASDLHLDTVAREYLGLTPADVALLTTTLPAGPELRECYQLGEAEPFRELETVDRFRRAATLTLGELHDLLYQDLCPAAADAGPPERLAARALFVHQDGVVSLTEDGQSLQYGSEGRVPVSWFERVNRFVRLARRTGLSFAELDLMLRACCGNRIDAVALRTIAVLVYLQRVLEQPMDVVVSLVAPMNELGLGAERAPRDLFNRVFNVPFADAERSVIRGSGSLPPAYAGMAVLSCDGDILAARNETYRRRITAALSLSDGDLAAIVNRYRDAGGTAGSDPRPFDGGAGVAELSLLHRVGRLATALGVPVTELFDLLDALDADPSIQRYAAFPLLIDPGVRVDRTDAVLTGGDVEDGLWLVQTLLGAVRWMRDGGFTGRELLSIAGGRQAREREPADAADGLAAVLDRIRQEFPAVELSPAVFATGRFSDRAAEVVHAVLAGDRDGVVSARDDRLLRVRPDRVAATAYAALAELPVIVPDDFLGLGLDERHTAKILTNLSLAGYLQSDATMVPERLPAAPADLRLAGAFGAHRERVFGLIAERCAGPAGDRSASDVPAETASFPPSGLAALDGLTDAERSELYDNLVFNGYLDPDGLVLDPGFFADPDNAAAFAVDADLGDIAADVLARLRERADRFGGEPVPLDRAVFAGLGLPEPQLAGLLDSLRFNGHIDAGDCYLDPRALLGLTIAEFGLALEFYPYRRRVLDAMQAHLRQVRAEALRVSEEDVRDIADMAVARRVVQRLDGEYVVDGAVPAEHLPFFADPGNTLAIDGLTDSEGATVFDRIAAILAEQYAYQFDVHALADLGLDAETQTRLVEHLVAAGQLTGGLMVPLDRIEFFSTVHNVLGFALPGFEDHHRDVFFALHAVGTEVAAAIAEIAAALATAAERQHAVLFTILADAFGVPAAVLEAICVAVTGSAADALDLLVAPALADPPPASIDVEVHRAFRRIRGFARLAAKLGLDADEVTLAVRDQRLADKFPEPLALPPGVDRIDALLDSADGHVYLFHGGNYWIYSAATCAPLHQRPKELRELSAQLDGLTAVDAAFVDADGTEWIVGRKGRDAGLTFARQRGSRRWAPRPRTWGTAANRFAESERIDAAFVDEAGRTYLFAGDQYVRYSCTDYAFVDEGYPRRIGDWWEGEQDSVALPAPFRRSLDAAFRGRDGRTYLFAGDRFVAVGPGPSGGDGDEPIGGTWGRVRNTLEAAERVDAGYAAGPTQFLFSGDQVVGYSDSIENDGVCADPGYPLRIESQVSGVPGEFAGGVEAAFVHPDGMLHLFKGGRTVTVDIDPASAASAPDTADIVPTAKKWGILDPVLPDGRVDAAFVGMDGRTYLFRGDRYVRYSTADYSVVDVGYPRGVAGDWGGLREVHDGFVQDGATYLFGAGGLLFALPAGPEPELDTDALSRAVRERLRGHGIGVDDSARLTGPGPRWNLTAEPDLVLAVRRVQDRVEVHCDPKTSARFHVRYSTKDYTKPDAGYPRPVADNWWNLPDELAGTDGFAQVDAVLGRPDRTYLFAGDRFVVFDNKRRWWSAPKSLPADWDSLPFDRVDAAFVGADDKTYVFSGQQYVRYSDGNYSRVDERYPAPITAMWGRVVNAIARTGVVDAALVLGPAADAPADSPTLTYLFSGDQFVRYTGTPYRAVDVGYPRSLTALAQEPRLGKLTARLERVDAAYADRRNVYLYSGSECHVVSDAAYRRYPDLPGSGATLATVQCAYLEDGAVMVERENEGWYRYSALEGTTVRAPAARPRTLRSAPDTFQTGLNAVLRGTDGNTYLFKGTSCFNMQLNREYPLAEEWGRPRNNVYHDNRVDAALVGRDGRTYLFSGDQFVTYPRADQVHIEGQPRPVAEHWGGLRNVALAFVRGGTTYLFEPPEPDGTSRYVAYSGDDYSAPDAGYPATTDASFWGIPDEYRPDGFVAPDAVLVEGDTMLLVTGAVCLQYQQSTGRWSYPRPLERVWPGLGPVTGLTAAFAGPDGATYFFLAGEFVRYHGGRVTERGPIRDRWGRSRNNFLAAGGTVDAAVVSRGVTYLFSGDQYVRYSGVDYRYADAGYPKPIAGNLRTEEAFANLPPAFDDELAERAASGARSLVDAAVANDRNSFLFTGSACHAVSRALTASYDVKALGRIRNTTADRRRIDAALVTDEHTFLFSGDQYVRYSGTDYKYVDDGYPKLIGASLPGELGVTTLPDKFHDGIDAAFRDAGDRTYLFAGGQYLRVKGGSTTTPASVAGVWGKVSSEFRPGGPIDAAFVGPAGDLYVFAGGQYVRYRPGQPEVVADGHPRRIKDNWGSLPPDFERGIDGAFVFAGRTYLCREDDYVRFDGERFDPPDRAPRQPFRNGWSDAVDYRLHDVRAISRFVRLARATPGAGLATFLLPGPGTFTDPYRFLADRFGWDVEELRWCRRHSRFLSGAPADEDRFEIEFLLELVDLFAVTDPLGAGPSRLRGPVWARLYEGGTDADLDAAAAVLSGLLARRHGAAEWAEVAEQLHDELNVRKRDALVPVVLAQSTGRDPEFRTSRDLFDHFLIDVDMGGGGRTSRVREAIAATQLYLHRYLLNLEEVPETDPPDPAAAEALQQRVKTWWDWMRSYRVWEANRKVFLYPENYLRPELRSTKTPAFRALESDLLQGEITPDTVERAYKRYLDEYTEVSRLTIAGGYVYARDRQPDGPRRLILFGRTKTDPRRYYYRRAEFSSPDRSSATWEPWQPVDVRIDSDHVHPVHAFGRVFVFWTAVEAVPADQDSGSPAVLVTDAGVARPVSTQAKSQVRIYYSFYNLNTEWVPAQTLATGPVEVGAIADVTLLVRPRVKDEDADRTSILVACSYSVTVPAEGDRAAEQRTGEMIYDLNPELYADDLRDDENDGAGHGAEAGDSAAVAGELVDRSAPAGISAGSGPSAVVKAGMDRVAQVFYDPVDPAGVVHFDHPVGSAELAWFSVDHKGGSFLCRPVTVTETEGTRAKLTTNRERLPAWSPVDAAVELPDGTRYFFDNTAHAFATADPTDPPARTGPIGDRWGRQRTVLPAPGEVDAVLRRGEHTYVFSDDQYVRFTGIPFETIDPGYPQKIERNSDRLPRWSKVDAAFTGRDGVEYFFSDRLGKFVTSANLNDPKDTREYWYSAVEGFGPVDAALVVDEYTYLISGRQCLRYPHPDEEETDAKRGKAKAQKGQADKGGEEKRYGEPDSAEPRTIDGTDVDPPGRGPISAALRTGGKTYYFYHQAERYDEVLDGVATSRPVYSPQSAVATTHVVDAAWVAGEHLYLTCGTEYVRYTLTPGAPVPTFIDESYPRLLPYRIDTAFTRGGNVFLFSGGGYAPLETDKEPELAPALRPTAGAWGELPRDGTPPFDAALDTESMLYLFLDGEYVRHAKTVPVPRPYQRAELPFELLRLTTGTASELNRRLLAGGVPALLDLATQQTDEVAVTTESGSSTAIRVWAHMVDPTRLPTGSHLDFRSANGLYYWEIFFHAPFLIAQALNSAQRFDDARQWYEYVFDPTNADSYWRFLPFLTVDLRALAESLSGDLAELRAARLTVTDLQDALSPVLGWLSKLAPAAAQNRGAITPDEITALAEVTSVETHDDLAAALEPLVNRKRLTAAARAALTSMQESIAVVADLRKQFDQLGDPEALLRAYQDNPFDPHAIADLRPVAYRRAIVMSYIDNLLDWGDMLFRQYTPESVDEARMLYVLAYDLLGERDDRPPTGLPAAAQTFAQLDQPEGELDLLGHLAAGGAPVADAVPDSLASEYFHIPENSVFDEYWSRVADRLRKIRQSLDIMGISQPLPLFAPPIDPMALVEGVASGAALDAVLASAAPAPPPAYRFAAVFRRAQELVDRLRQFGAELLDVLERRDAEELSLLRGRHEAAILAMTRDIKQAQIRIAEESLAELTAGQAAARERAGHYQKLIEEGLSQLERAQLGLMASAAYEHVGSSVLRAVAGIAKITPQIKAGPFIWGTETGGQQIGDALENAAGVAESLGEGLSVLGELLGARAQQERTAQEWELQLKAARSDLIQIDHQVTAATQQLAVARREAALLDQQMAQDEAVAGFMRDKFGTAELYGWMSDQLAGRYFQAYHLAHDMAKAAERAYQFERGVPESQVNHIRPMYWESRRGGLLAGQSLAVDLENLGKAYFDSDERGLEITKQISLLELDPLVLLRLRDSGSCDFALAEAEFDYDFPGHYRRQLRTLTVTFVDADGGPLWVNGTLTQLHHTTVLQPDAKAVRYLLDADGAPPEALRSDWRPSQQIAVSEVDGENNGLFELRFDDDRYLPFERTGAISTWRLERTGRALADPYDIILTVKYTAQQGGPVFANTVRGMLKPYPAARFFDVAREFPDEWAAFLDGEAPELALPLTPELFPGMASRQISAIYPAFEAGDGSAFQLVLNGGQNLPLSGGRLQATPGLAIGGDPGSPLRFTVRGDRQALHNIGLVFTYQARVH